MLRVNIIFHANSDESVIEDIGGIVFNHLESIPSLLIADIPEDKLTDLENHPLIKVVEKDVFDWTPQGVENIPFSDGDMNAGKSVADSYSDYLHFYYDKQFIQLKTYIDRGLTGKGVKVAIIEGSGANHVNLKAKGGYIANPGITSYLDAWAYHSTSVAGILAAQPHFAWDGNEWHRLTGVAPDVDYYHCVAGDPAQAEAVSTSYAISCMNWCITNKIDIVSCSWGGGSYSASFETAVNTFTNNGGFVVVAAGNDGTTDTTLEQIGFPANLANCISVAGIDETKARLSESSTGSQNMFAMPASSVQTLYSQDRLNSTGTQSTAFTGTSAASPAFAGILALYKQAFPKKTRTEILTLVQSRVYDFGLPARNKIYGYGMPLPSNEIRNLPIKSEKGLVLDEHSTYFESPISSILNLRDTFTVELTVTIPQGSGGYGFGQWDNTGNIGNFYGCYLGETLSVYQIYNNAGTSTANSYGDYYLTSCSSSPCTYHVVYNYPTVSVYLNGSLRSSYSMIGQMLGSSTDKVRFGRYLRGFYHKSRMYNRVLSQNEITQTVNGSRISNGLVLEYIFTGKETTTINDTSGNNLHGTIYGGARQALVRIK